MPEDGHNFFCPVCQALNLPNAVVCASCGVNLREVREAMPYIQERKAELAHIHRDELDNATSLVVVGEASRSRKLLKVQIGVALWMAFAFGVVIAIATLAYAYQQRSQQQRLAAKYEAAVDCFQNEEFVCARDALVDILDSYPNNDSGRALLLETRYQLARQYVSAGLWDLALQELNELLKHKPYDEPALALLKETYDRWIADEVGQGNFFSAMRLRIQRDARFAP